MNRQARVILLYKKNKKQTKDNKGPFSLHISIKNLSSSARCNFPNYEFCINIYLASSKLSGKSRRWVRILNKLLMGVWLSHVARRAARV